MCSDRLPAPFRCSGRFAKSPTPAVGDAPAEYYTWALAVCVLFGGNSALEEISASFSGVPEFGSTRLSYTRALFRTLSNLVMFETRRDRFGSCIWDAHVV